jgi:hypothetical protein
VAWRVNSVVKHEGDSATIELADGFTFLIRHEGDKITVHQEGARTVGLVVRPVAGNVIEVRPDVSPTEQRLAEFGQVMQRVID